MIARSYIPAAEGRSAVRTVTVGAAGPSNALIAAIVGGDPVDPLDSVLEGFWRAWGVETAPADLSDVYARGLGELLEMPCGK